MSTERSTSELTEHDVFIWDVDLLCRRPITKALKLHGPRQAEECLLGPAGSKPAVLFPSYRQDALTLSAYPAHPGKDVIRLGIRNSMG